MTEPDAPAVARLPIDDLTPHPRNVREGDVGAIAESLRAFGQYRPVVAQRQDDGPHVILAGTHTWRAAKSLGWAHIDAVIWPFDDDEALRVMLADNRTHDLGRNRDDDLATLLTELGVPGMVGTGYDGDALDDLLRDLGRYDPGAGILSRFEGVTGPGAEEGTFAEATRVTPTGEYVTLSFSVTLAQRGVIMAAIKRAQKAGYTTQPEALVAVAERYTEDAS